MERFITSTAPGRICLFGEHQDYLGLPVIAAAVDLRAKFVAGRVEENRFFIAKPDVGESEEIDFSKPIVYEKPRDYLKSGARVMMKRGRVFRHGLRAEFTSEIPICKGCSGSSAMLVAWVALLGAASGGETLRPEEIARLAYEAEVLEFGEPGGMMDHFASALGGLLHIETRGGFSAHSLAAPAGVAFVLGDSLEPKDTAGVLGRTRANVEAGLDYLKQKAPDFSLETISEPSAADMFGSDISDAARGAVLANIRNRDITRIALALFNGCGADAAELGPLLDAHHANLRDGLGISTPKIEALISAAKHAGASGCKINGSGGGGCMIACCPGAPELVAEAIENAGGKAYILKVCGGVEVI